MSSATATPVAAKAPTAEKKKAIRVKPPMTPQRMIKKVGFYVMVAVVAVYMVFPFYWAINSSFKSESQLAMTPATFIPRDPATMDVSFFMNNYDIVMGSDTFRRAVINSIIVATLVTFLALAIGSFAAFALGKLRFPGKKTALYTILSMTMFPQIAILTGLYAIIRSVGITPRPSMVLTYLIFSLPFTVWVLTSFFQTLPGDLLQAAEVDGATTFQAFRLILLPLTAPALVTTGLLAFIGAWNEYLFALTFTTINPDDRTIPVAIALFAGERAMQDPFGQIMAAAVLVTIPLLVLVLIFQRRIIGGLAGAVKG